MEMMIYGLLTILSCSLFFTGTSSANNTVFQAEIPQVFSIEESDYIVDTVSGSDVVGLAPTIDTFSEFSSVEATALTALPTSNAYQLTDYYINYFAGILQNKPKCNYFAYADRVYNGTSYIMHYYLVYNVKKDVSGDVVAGSYPRIDCYTYNSVYYQTESNVYYSYIPSFGYGSFDGMSALVNYSFDWRSFVVILSAGLVLLIVFRRR